MGVTAPDGRTSYGKVAVLGIGVTGMAVARFLLSEDGSVSAASVSVFDQRDDSTLREAGSELERAGARVFLGATELDGTYDLAIASPGIPPHSSLFVSAEKQATELMSEIELAYLRAEAPWLAVTGTNGKTTVTSLCTHLLRSAGRPAECVGNIGDPAIDVADHVGSATVIVAEVSSFQLALTRRFRPKVAVLLNITQDHVDWHGSFEAYTADKMRMFAHLGSGDTAVIDIDDPVARSVVEQVERSGAHVVRVSRGTVSDGGAGVVDGMLCITTSHGLASLIHVDELGIRGDHNVSNALAAAAAVSAMGVPPDLIARGLKTFEPIAHRLEPVATIHDVEYVNDSKATNPGATLMALSAFPERPVILMLGGRNKGSDFADLAAAVSDCRAVIAFGEAREEIAAALTDATPEILVMPRMIDALGSAREYGRPGDVVLLSPACASFDEFSGYAERGRVFSDAVRSWTGAQVQ